MDVELRAQYFDQLEKELGELLDPQTQMLSEKYSKVIDCTLCQSGPKHQEKLFVKRGYTFVRCQECGMIFTNPQVSEELANKKYANSLANNLWVEIQKSEKEQSWKSDYYGESIKIIARHLKVEQPKLLDIGCGTGQFLQILKEKVNWRAKGLELNEAARAFAQEKGLDVWPVLLSELEDDDRYDVFTLFGVLEHLHAPQKILEDIKTRASKVNDSFVFIIVPNVNSLYHMFLQGKSLSFDGRNHLQYFSKQTLERLLTKNGFEIVHSDTVLTGLSNIKRQAQWFDPNSNVNTDKYLSPELKNLLDQGEVEKFILKNDLGLRLRVLARWRLPQ